MNESIKHMPSGREQLLNLEATDKYVFHGSENPELDSLEPRQAYNNVNGVREPDGDPAVFASTKADYAIMMALINNKNCPKGWRSSASSSSKTRDSEVILTLRARKDGMEQLNDKSSGYVYIFDRDLFEKRQGSVEYMSKFPVIPADKVKVTKSDLPPYIEVFNS